MTSEYSLRRRPASWPTASRSRTYWSTSWRIVAGRYRARLYTRSRSSRPSWSLTYMVRSNFDPISGWEMTSTVVPARPPKSVEDPKLIMLKKTWKSGVRPRSRGGCRSMRRCSNGTSWLIERPQAHVADPFDELEEGGIAGEVGAEDQRVEEHADHAFDLGPDPPGRRACRRRCPRSRVRRASSTSKAASITMKGVTPSRDAVERTELHHSRGQRRLDLAAIERLSTRPDEVARELTDRQRALELLPPVVELLGQLVARDPRPLPGGIVERTRSAGWPAPAAVPARCAA